MQLLLIACLIVSQRGIPKEKTQTVDAVIKGIAPGQLLVEVEGQSGVVAMNRQTQLTVTGTIEASLLSVGSVVAVNGYLREPGVISDAKLTLHTNPKQTVRAGVRNVEQRKPFTCYGRVASLEPLAIVCFDGLALVGPMPADAGPGAKPPTSRPAYNQTLTVKANIGEGGIGANFGAMPVLISEGDTAKITVPERGPRVARKVMVKRDKMVTRAEITGESADDASDSKKDGAKKDDAAK